MVDTNSIHTAESKLTLVNESFLKWWEAQEAKGDLELFIPQTVFSEILSQKTRHLKKEFFPAIKSLKKISGNLGFECNVSTIKNEAELKKCVDKKLFSQFKTIPKCQIALTPYARISENLQSIIESAISRRAPFKDSNEGEGFRDSLILETVKDIQNSNLHVEVIFITNDNRLKEAAFDYSKATNNLVVLGNTSEVEGYLDAARSSVNPEFLRNVINKAQDLFEGINDKFAETIRQAVIEKFELKSGKSGWDKADGKGLLNLGTLYNCLGDPMLYTLKTEFLSLIGKDNFHWASYIGIFCDYSRSSTILGSDNDGPRERRIICKVEWESKVNENLEFSTAVPISIVTLDDVYQEPNKNDDFSEIGS